MASEETREEPISLPDWTPQFSLLDAFFAMTFVAIFVVLYPLERSLIQTNVFPCAVLLVAGWLARRGVTPDLAWSVFAFGWMLALAFTCDRSINCYMHLGNGSTAAMLAYTPRELLNVCVYGLSLPLFVSLRAFPLLLKMSQGRRSFVRGFLILGPILGIADIILTTGLSMYIWGYYDWSHFQ